MVNNFSEGEHSQTILIARMDWLWSMIRDHRHGMDITKIDVQGMELEVLREMRSLLAKYTAKLGLEAPPGVSGGGLLLLMDPCGEESEGALIYGVPSETSLEVMTPPDPYAYAEEVPEPAAVHFESRPRRLSPRVISLANKFSGTRRRFGFFGKRSDTDEAEFTPAEPPPKGTRRLAPWFRRTVTIGASLVVLGTILGAVVVLSPSIPGMLGHSPAPVVWNTSSLQRVSPTDPPGTQQQVELSAALGESESFQIITRAPDNSDLKGLNVAVSDLTGPNGQVISKSNIRLYREYYVNIGPDHGSPNWHGPNQPLGPGWYPDALIPFTDPNTGAVISGAKLQAAPYDLLAGKNQPIWVDITVPRNAVPGQYSGTYNVTSKGHEVTGQISLNVWNFALPRQPSLTSSFLVSKSRNLATFTELLRHRLMPDSVPPAMQAKLVNDYGLGASGINLWAGDNCNILPPPSVETIQKTATAQHPKLLLYDYSSDKLDRCEKVFPSVKQWAQNLHASGVLNLVTMGPIPPLLDDGSGTKRSAVDIWPILPQTYNADVANVQRALQKGDHIWSYNTEVQDPYSPKWEIDFAPINFRIQPGFISQSLHLTGLLYWSVDRWSPDPWNDVVLKDGNNTYPGDGQLLYPGTIAGVAGVVPSMRLKWLRDGVDDFDYIQLLKQAGYGDQAIEIANSVGPDWTHWTRDPKALEAARLKLGQLLDNVSKQPNVRLASSAPGGDTQGR